MFFQSFFDKTVRTVLVVIIAAVREMLMDILHINVKHTMGCCYLLLEIQEGKEQNLKKIQLEIDQIH